MRKKNKKETRTLAQHFPSRKGRKKKLVFLGYCGKCGEDVETDYCYKCQRYVQGDETSGKEN